MVGGAAMRLGNNTSVPAQYAPCAGGGGGGYQGGGGGGCTQGGANVFAPGGGGGGSSYLASGVATASNFTTLLGTNSGLGAWLDGEMTPPVPKTTGNSTGTNGVAYFAYLGPTNPVNPATAFAINV